MTLGELIKKYRKVKGYTHRSVGEAIGVDHSFIAKIESGKKGASKEVLEQLAELLDIDKTELLRMQGFHAESKGTELEKEYPGAVDILYSANKDLDVNGKKVMELMMIQVKQALESNDIKKVIESGGLNIEALKDDVFTRALLEVLKQSTDENGNQ